MRHINKLLCGLLLAALTILAAPSPTNARFLQPDTWDPWLAGVDINRYAYSGNDPINGSDPFGHMGVPSNPYSGRTMTLGEGLDNIQSLLDVAGFAPGVGIGPDLANSAIDALRGNYGSAAINLAVAVPIIGDAAKLGKMAKSALRHFDDIPTFGKEQITRGAAGIQHAARSENLARSIVNKYGAENVKSISYNRRLSTIFPGVADARLPDVVVELKNGDAIIGEIASSGQTTVSQVNKAQSMSRSIPNRNVTIEVDAEMASDGAASLSRNETIIGGQLSGSANPKAQFGR
ncbi:hypothetical protein BH10PSE7_BH10PSE7_44990 [soil metagenome]